MFPVNYDSCNWKMLSQYLQGPDRERIPVLTRAKLLHDSWNLAYSGELCFKIALNMTLFLKEERSHVVWEPVFMMIDHIGRRIEGSDVYPKFEVNIFYLRTTSNIYIYFEFYTPLYLILISIYLFFKHHTFLIIKIFRSKDVQILFVMICHFSFNFYVYYAKRITIKFEYC